MITRRQALGKALRTTLGGLAAAPAFASARGAAADAPAAFRIGYQKSGILVPRAVTVRDAVWTDPQG